MHTGRTPWGHEERDQGNASPVKEHQRLQANHQKLGGRYGIDSPSQPSERTNPADTLISDF